ncbi:siderophore-interacting protein [Micrococcales bacterium 31B]|nr:siderophore-interacting protein [Micrococcales bacterium 31B]
MPVIATITARRQLTPDMVRLKFSLDAGDFDPSRHTDAYVKIVLPRPGTHVSEPVDEEAARAELPREAWPVRRTYTVRSYDPRDRTLVIDFVIHGDEGIAGPWARGARVGSRVTLLGPGGKYAPDPGSAWHLLVGDESALPAIAATLELLHEPQFKGSTSVTVVSIDNAAEQQDIMVPPGASVHWLVRNSDVSPSEQVLDVLRGLDFESLPQAFVHGEAAMVRDVRRYLRGEHSLPLDALSASGYWRQGHTDEGWRAVKREWNASLEAEEVAAS